MERVRNVAILLFHDVEVLDFCGPFEVFSVAGRQKNPPPFHVYTCAENAGPILARNQLSVNPRCTIHDCPPPDVVVVPGGIGTRRELHNAVLIEWIKDASAKAELVLSVCTGALLLAKAELLDSLHATTHHGSLQLLKELAPRTTIHADQRYVDNGKIILSAGISAGIDMSLHVVERLLGRAEALATAQHMEYAWQPNGLPPA